MIKIIAPLTRNPKMSLNEFKKYCLEQDAAKVKLLPGVRKLSYSFVNEIPRGDMRADGFVELWFDSLDAMSKAFETPVGQELVADEEHFLDVDKLTVFLTEEHEFIF